MKKLLIVLLALLLMVMSVFGCGLFDQGEETPAQNSEIEDTEDAGNTENVEDIENTEDPGESEEPEQSEESEESDEPQQPAYDPVTEEILHGFGWTAEEIRVIINRSIRDTIFEDRIDSFSWSAYNADYYEFEGQLSDEITIYIYPEPANDVYWIRAELAPDESWVPQGDDLWMLYQSVCIGFVMQFDAANSDDFDIILYDELHVTYNYDATLDYTTQTSDMRYHFFCEDDKYIIEISHALVPGY